MLYNYHTHTYLCKHASGTPREYIENAIASGFGVLGFSDHVPCPFPGDYSSFIRMDVEETPQYVSMMSALREEFRSRIAVFIGYEAEYYPELFPDMLKNITKYECDYLILGQHYIRNEYDGAGSGMLTDDKKHLTDYVSQVIEGLNTGVFSYLAHPDMVQYRGDWNFYRKEMTDLCEAAKALDIPLEINLQGLSEGRPYPTDEFWAAAAKVGNKVILGCDAHRPDVLASPAGIELGLQYAASFGIKPITELEMRRVRLSDD